MGRWRTLRSSGTVLPDQVDNFGRMPSYTRKLKDLVREEMERLRHLRNVAQHIREALLEAAGSLLEDSGTTAEFHLREVSKCVTFLFRGGGYTHADLSDFGKKQGVSVGKMRGR